MAYNPVHNARNRRMSKTQNEQNLFCILAFRKEGGLGLGLGLGGGVHLRTSFSRTNR